MRFSVLATAATAATVQAAGRPKDTPICDFYTSALLKDNTAKNQATLLTLLVNTVVIGNYTMPNHNAVPGILAPGKVNGEDVNLLPYFNGGLASSNRNNKAVVMNFLDGGAAEPLKKNMPANDKTSNQYFLLTHLYEFFGALLGCSKMGMSGFDAYSGTASMYEVHKFMDLNSAQTTYFIDQVALAAQSFGVATDDITAVGTALNGLFNVRCGPKTAVIPASGKQLQSICIASDCPLAKNDTCSAYAAVATPSAASSAVATPTSSTPAGSSTSPATKPDNGATANGVSLGAALLAGLAAFAL